MPMLYMDISNGILSIGGLAAIKRAVLSEPLMRPNQLYLSNFPQQKLALARTMAAIRLTLGKLVAEQHGAFIGNKPQRRPGRPWLLCQGKYESWRGQKLWGDNVYLLHPPQEAVGSQNAESLAASPQDKPVKLVAKFWQPQDEHAVGDLVQAAWHKQGVAPEVVSAECSILPCVNTGLPQSIELKCLAVRL